MFYRLIMNDMKKNKLNTIVIAVFVLIAALLVSLASLVLVNLNNSIDNLMKTAKTPHYLQMHSGVIDEERLNDFVKDLKYVENWQILNFLNIDGSDITIGESSLAGIVQDNGLSIQSDKFDYLLDLDNNIIQPDKGEIYLPLYYMKKGYAKSGDKVVIKGIEFKVAGFLRDSIMNSALISSKRFLVNIDDFEKLRQFGMLEYLIEFRFNDMENIDSFESLYIEKKLEANGPPPINYMLVKLANAITDGIMIVILIFISTLVIVVAFLCIRFTLLTKIEEDYKEVGVLKAIGINHSFIKKLYLAKYCFIAALSCISGLLLSFVLQLPLLENIRLYMGKSDCLSSGIILGAVVVFLIFFTITLYINSILNRFRKISASEAIRFGAPEETKSIHITLKNNSIFSTNTLIGIINVLSRKKLYLTIFLVLLTASFIINVPFNLYNTISSRHFITNMG